ncbi:MAG: 2Fe-2S iron-sulfur cluster-binding protein [Bdellovibrionia bacterium]
MPKCTINGHEVEVHDGGTIMEAFQKQSQEIAYYCWHPGLSVAGACRMCMVEIEGNPKPQIACNTPVVEGMKISNKTEKVKDSVKWTLDFHLINHPLDCPICDQAGECGLQEFYMEYGKYDPEMSANKVKKAKAMDLGPTVVLDTERCILCSRCVRFTDEVSKTSELGIFNRGDRAEIGTFENKPLDNKYSVNVVDICPVGALTSKDFRFKQRVWYLKDFETLCNGCSTGCNVKISYNQTGLYRVKPIYNEKVNGHWMCDEGRDIYKFVNLEARLKHARHNSSGRVSEMPPQTALEQVGELLRQTVAKSGPDSVALVLTAQYSVEELESLVNYFAKDLKSKKIYHWKNNPETFEKFDGLLLRGDKNPNTAGLMKVLADAGVKTDMKDLEGGLDKVKVLVVAGPENQAVYPDLAMKATKFAKASTVVWLTAGRNTNYDLATWQIPMKSYTEKTGTFINAQGLSQRFKKGVSIVPDSLSLEEVVERISVDRVSNQRQVEARL